MLSNTVSSKDIERSKQLAMDVSADLPELSRCPVGLVSAGVKSILDIGRCGPFISVCRRTLIALLVQNPRVFGSLCALSIRILLLKSRRKHLVFLSCHIAQLTISQLSTVERVVSRWANYASNVILCL